jgi:hypothetical protein
MPGIYKLARTFRCICAFLFTLPTELQLTVPNPISSVNEIAQSDTPGISSLNSVVA